MVQLFQVLSIEEEMKKLYNAKSDTPMTEHHFRQYLSEPDLVENMMVGSFLNCSY